jgi:hypothetical protein
VLLFRRYLAHVFHSDVSYFSFGWHLYGQSKPNLLVRLEKKGIRGRYMRRVAVDMKVGGMQGYQHRDTKTLSDGSSLLNSQGRLRHWWWRWQREWARLNTDENRDDVFDVILTQTVLPTYARKRVWNIGIWCVQQCRRTDGLHSASLQAI